MRDSAPVKDENQAPWDGARLSFRRMSPKGRETGAGPSQHFAVRLPQSRPRFSPFGLPCGQATRVAPAAPCCLNRARDFRPSGCPAGRLPGSLPQPRVASAIAHT